MLKALNKHQTTRQDITNVAWPDGTAKIFHQRSKQPQRNRRMLEGPIRLPHVEGRAILLVERAEKGGKRGIREHIARRLLCATSRRASGVNGTKGVYREL